MAGWIPVSVSARAHPAALAGALIVGVFVLAAGAADWLPHRRGAMPPSDTSPRGCAGKARARSAPARSIRRGNR